MNGRWISVFSASAFAIVTSATATVGAQARGGAPSAAARPAAGRPAAARPATARPAAGRPATARTAGAARPGRGRPVTAPTPPPVVATPTPPVEDPTVVQARQAYNEGRRLFDAHDWEPALEQFRRAFELRANPIVLLPIADCQVNLGRIPGAIESLERYVRERPTAADRAAIETRLTALRARPATLHIVSTPAGARIFVDGTAVAQTTPADLPAPAGHHAIRLELEGRTAFSSEVDAGPGARIEVTGDLPVASSAVAVAPPTPPVDRPPTVRRTNPAVWVATVLAGAGLITGSVFGLLALSDRAEYDARPTVAIRDTGERNALIADIGFGVAVLSAGVAVVVHLSSGGAAPAASSPGRSDRRTPSPRFGMAPNGFALSF